MSDPSLQKVLLELPKALQLADVEPIGIGQSGSQVYRLHPAKSKPVILKITRPHSMPEYLSAGYPNIALTEYNFYTLLAPKFSISCPRLLRHGRLPRRSSYLLLEDISQDNYVPDYGHTWTTAELLSVTTTYAQMHGRAQKLFAEQGVPPWLNPDPRTTYSTHKIAECWYELANNSWTEAAKPIARAATLKALLTDLEGKLNHVPSTLLFNDFYPPNVALPESNKPAILFDYQLIGSGPLHVDIVNIGFLSEDKAFSRVDKDAVLAHYLSILGQETSVTISVGSFRHYYHYANLLAWADFLPRFVRAMHRSNTKNEHWGAWMDEMFAKCINEWSKALEE